MNAFNPIQDANQSATFWGFPVSNGLHERLSNTLAEIKVAEKEARGLNKQLSELVYELVKEGLQAYYHQPASIIPMSSAKQSAIDKGVKVISGAIKVVIGQFFGSLDLQRLNSVALYIENMLFADADSDGACLIFELDQTLHTSLSYHLEKVRGDDFSEQDINALIDGMQQVVKICIVHYYHKPTDLVEMQGLARSMSDLAIRNVHKAFDSFLEKLLSRLEQDQLIQMSECLESRLYEQPVAAQN